MGYRRKPPLTVGVAVPLSRPLPWMPPSSCRHGRGCPVQTPHRHHRCHCAAWTTRRWRPCGARDDHSRRRYRRQRTHHTHSHHHRHHHHRHGRCFRDDSGRREGRRQRGNPRGRGGRGGPTGECPLPDDGGRHSWCGRQEKGPREKGTSAAGQSVRDAAVACVVSLRICPRRWCGRVVVRRWGRAGSLRRGIEDSGSTESNGRGGAGSKGNDGTWGYRSCGAGRLRPPRRRVVGGKPDGRKKGRTSPLRNFTCAASCNQALSSAAVPQKHKTSHSGQRAHTSAPAKGVHGRVG